MADGRANDSRPPTGAEASRSVLACAIGDVDAAIYLDRVQAVIREPRARVPVPGAGPHEWLIRFAGRMLTAVDLPALWGLAGRATLRRAGVIARIGSASKCLIVDRVHGIYAVLGAPYDAGEAAAARVDLVPDHHAPRGSLAVIDERFFARLPDAAAVPPRATPAPPAPMSSSSADADFQ